MFLFERIVRANNYDFCFVLDFTPKYVEFAYAVMRKDALKIGFKSERPNLLDKENVYPYQRHVIENNFSLLTDLVTTRISEEDFLMDFFIPENIYNRIDNDFKHRYSRIEKYFVVHPGATNSFPCRRWSNQGFSEIIDFLAGNNLDIFITGIKSDRNTLDEIISGCRYKDKIVLFLDKSLYEVAYLIKSSRGILCGDTGILHLARALGAPMVCLFGPSDPLHTGPIGPGVYRVVREDFNCGPCNYFPDYRKEEKKYCMGGKTTSCMQAIAVDDVKQGLKEIGAV